MYFLIALSMLQFSASYHKYILPSYFNTLLHLLLESFQMILNIYLIVRKAMNNLGLLLETVNFVNYSITLFLDSVSVLSYF